MRTTALFVILIGCLSLSQQLDAEDATADADFQVQGEYSGLVRDGLVTQRIGLQVIAQGEGSFEARVFIGGLPGSGWNNQPPAPLKGQRIDGRLVFEDDLWRISLDNARTAAIAYRGQPRGKLHHVQRGSSTLGNRPPRSAIVLFDGQQPEQLEGARVSEDGLLMEGVTTTMPVGDFRLHLEFRLPYMPTARGQGRANSGVYIQRRYEVQILDSFGLAGANNECGGLYKQRSPQLNMCLPPMAWQTYDILFKAARWEDDRKVGNAEITVLHNGIAIHENQQITNKTGAGQAESPQPLPLHLQNHGNPVRFRNIWIVTDEASLAKAHCRGRIIQRRGSND